MGEIKSTLELVLEKTKHLTLSEEEKEDQKRGELKMKTAGLLQKYLDRMVKRQQLDKELADLQETYGLSDYAFLNNEIIDKLALDTDNGPLLSLLKDFSDLNVTEFECIVQKYRDAVQSATQKSTAEAKEDLKEKHGISGSAIVPNLEANDAWRIEVQMIRDEFQQQLEEEKRRCLSQTKKLN
jgi:hypothetical protein